jgi:hypothetical protein
MRRTIQALFLSLLAAEVLVVGQGADARRVLTELRAALGGEEKLSAVKTVAIEGQVTRPSPNGTSMASDFELAFELPDKYMKSDVFANLGGTQLKRRTGFNGAEVFEEMDAPPGMMGGNMHVMRMGPGAMPGGQATPEQLERQRAQILTISRREFARLALGMFGSSFSPLPLEFKYAGQAESSDGKADILEVQGADGFTAKLFVDGKSHLPLMLTWMDKEPLTMTMRPGGPGAAEMAEQMKQAEANRRIVEHRMFYADYKAVEGVKLPTRIQRMMEGLPTEELALEKIKVNGKIDPNKFKNAKVGAGHASSFCRARYGCVCARRNRGGGGRVRGGRSGGPVFRPGISDAKFEVADYRLRSKRRCHSRRHRHRDTAGRAGEARRPRHSAGGDVRRGPRHDRRPCAGPLRHHGRVRRLRDRHPQGLPGSRRRKQARRGPPFEKGR